MAACGKLYRPGAVMAGGVNPALPSGVGANHETCIPLGAVKRTLVRCTGNGAGAPDRAPTAATAPGTPEPTGGTGYGRAENGGTPAAPGGIPAWRMLGLRCDSSW